MSGKCEIEKHAKQNLKLVTENPKTLDPKHYCSSGPKVVSFESRIPGLVLRTFGPKRPKVSQRPDF